MKIYDITKPITEGTKRFQSEPVTKIRKVCEINAQSPVNVSAINISSHAGTHCDAPSHYSKLGRTIDQIDLSVFIGKCSVIHLQHIKTVIKASDIRKSTLEERVLFKVHESEEAHAYFSECCIEYMASHGVKLIGTSAISIDAYSSKLMLSHLSCLKHNMQIVEGLYLDEVDSGTYIFIGFPLKLIGSDASPIRAALIQGTQLC